MIKTNHFKATHYLWLNLSVTYETTISYDGVHDHNIAQLRKFKANPAAANMKVTTILIRLDDESEFELIEKAESEL